MSHIDSFAHALVGYLFGVPVYLSLEAVDGDFCCPPRSLVIGGGSGEHPAAVLADADAAVARYVAAELPALRLRPGQRAAWAATCQPHSAKASDQVLRHFGWSDELYLSHRLACQGGNGSFTSERDGCGTATRLRVACVGRTSPMHAFTAEIGFVAAGTSVSIVAVSLDGQILDDSEVALMARAIRTRLDAEPVKPARGRR